MTTDFDLAVIGGGSAGLAAAGVAAHLGARTALIERDRLGGDCTWTGCIPSKALLNAAHTAETVRRAHRFGIHAQDLEIDFHEVMQRIRSVQRSVYERADTPEHFEAMGVTVLHGASRFVDPHTLRVQQEGEPTTLRARFIVIATGSHPRIPQIDGLDEVSYLTTETLFDLDRLPDHLLIIGGGRVGIEMAQAFRRLGAEVTVVESGREILSRDEPESARRLREILQSEGIGFRLGVPIRRAVQAAGSVRLHLDDGSTVSGTALLVAAGRMPAVHDLDLPAAGVRFGESGILIDTRCRTSARHIYAIGDVVGGHGSSHRAEHMAKIAVASALLKSRRAVDDRHMPDVTFTRPELAHIGATAAELRARGARFETYRFPFDRIDRAETTGATEGFILIHTTPWSGRILGASILGARAGELIGEVALAMRNGISLRRLSDTIHPYPTYGLGVRRAADQWYVRRRPTTLLRALGRTLGYRGDVVEIGPDEVI